MDAFNFKTMEKITIDVMNKNESDEEVENVDINDYEKANDDEDYIIFVDLLNVYNCYYKQLHQKKQESTLFEDVNMESDDSTNKCLEFLYEEMFKYKKSLVADKDFLYDPSDSEVDINKWEEMYALYIEEEHKYVCKYILPLLHYVASLDWTLLNWNIRPLKK